MSVLEELLIQARARELKSVAVAAEFADGTRVGIGGRYKKDPTQAIAALRNLKRHLQWGNSFREQM